MVSGVGFFEGVEVAAGQPLTRCFTRIDDVRCRFIIIRDQILQPSDAILNRPRLQVPRHGVPDATFERITIATQHATYQTCSVGPHQVGLAPLMLMIEAWFRNDITT